MSIENIKIFRKISKKRRNKKKMYESEKIATRIKTIAKIKKIPVKQVLEKADLSYNMMSMMKKSVPKADSLAKIADVLEVSTDYLLGRTDKV